MVPWLARLLGRAPGRERETPIPPPPSIPEDDELEAEGELGFTPLGGEARDFLIAMVEHHEPSELQNLSQDDRMFISGVLKSIREGSLEIPLLPKAALRIQDLLASPEAAVSDFVEVLITDPALSTEVLKVSNSAYYHFPHPARTLNEAIVRIGLNQLRALVLMMHLRGKVLRTGVFPRESDWITDLAMATAQMCSSLARELGLPRHEGFTRGLLLHVEHFILMGAVAEVSKTRKRRLRPTRDGLLVAILRFGPAVRSLAAKTWGLDEQLTRRISCDDHGNTYVDMYSRLQRLLIKHWSGERPHLMMEGVPTERLAAAIDKSIPKKGSVFGEI